MTILQKVRALKARIEVTSDQEKYVVGYYLSGAYNSKNYVANVPYSAYPFIGFDKDKNVVGWNGCSDKGVECISFRDFLKEILDLDSYTQPKVDGLL